MQLCSMPSPRVATAQSWLRTSPVERASASLEAAKSSSAGVLRQTHHRMGLKSAARHFLVRYSPDDLAACVHAEFQRPASEYDRFRSLAIYNQIDAGISRRRGSDQNKISMHGRRVSPAPMQRIAFKRSTPLS